MKLLGLLLIGFSLAILQGEVATIPWMPLLPALFLSFVLLRLEESRLWLKVLLLTTGCATGSALPLGAWWLAAGLASIPIVGMRGLLFVRHPVIQALAAAWTAGCFLLAGALSALLGTGTGPTGNVWWLLGSTLVAGPLVHRLLEGLAAMLPGRALPPFPRDSHFRAARM